MKQSSLTNDIDSSASKEQTNYARREAARPRNELNRMSTITKAPETALPEPIRVCGYNITPIQPNHLVDYVVEQVNTRQGGWVLALNLDLVSRGIREPEFSTLIHGAELTIADGHPLVWLMKKKRANLDSLERATGSDLTRALLHRVPASEVAIIGGKDPRLAISCEGLNPQDAWFIFDGIVRFEEEWIEDLYQQIKDRSLVFVALGVPKQERLIKILKEKMPETTFIGVGGSFEFLAGITRRAPDWMQRRGLEWLYRCYREPKRIGKRVVFEYIPGVVAVLKEGWGFKRA